jgi:NAD(P)-dependent dehydrogenase (short-subunit alcohol dehydrogenase family)
LTTEAAVNKLFEWVKKDFGKIDIVVNTVGKVLKKPIREISEAEYDDMFAYAIPQFIKYSFHLNELTAISVNSKSAFFILKAGAKNVEDGGKLITIVTALLAAFTGFYTSYAGSKAPVEHFTRGVAKELQPRRISVNAVAPGPMDTRENSPTTPPSIDRREKEWCTLTFDSLFLPTRIARGCCLPQESSP